MRFALLLTLAVALSLDAQVVRGRITDADGKPVANAKVLVGIADRPSLDFIEAESVTTAADGHYAIALPPFTPEERASLIVLLPAHAIVHSKVFSVADVEPQIDVTLPRFQRVAVRVADVDGKPVKDARIQFVPSDEAAVFESASEMLHARYESRTLRTDEAGEATLHLVPGSWAFAARAPGHLATMIPEQTIKRGVSVALMLKKSVAIRGRVHRKGTAVADAIIYLRSEDNELSSPVRTAKDGTFESPDLGPGKYSLLLTKEDELLEHSIDAIAPATLDVELPAAGTLRMRFVDALSREPIRQFGYSIESENDTGDGTPATGLYADTNDGVITHTLSNGRYRVSGHSREHRRSEPIEVRVDDRQPAEVTIALDRGITIRGRVSDEHDEPIAGANVVIDSEDGNRRLSGRSATSTEADGSFAISGLGTGRSNLVVQHEGFAPFVRLLDEIRDTELDVELTRGLSLTGIVRRAGKPLANLRIDASTNVIGGTSQNAISDADGRFVLRGLIAGRYTVVAASGDERAEVTAVVPATREVVLSLDPIPTGAVFGVVTGLPTNLGGKIVSRTVFARTADPFVEEQYAEGTIDESGAYRINGAPAGRVFVGVAIGSLTGTRSTRRKQVDVIEGQSLRVDLDLGGGIAVRGRVTYDGKPLAQARIQFMNYEGVDAAIRSRVDGMYEAVLSTGGRYDVDAVSEYGRVQFTREIHAGDVIDIELRRQTIEGTVVDAITRTPIPNAEIVVARESDPDGSRADRYTTDRHGRFSSRVITTGPHRVMAFTPGYAQAVQTIHLGATSPSLLLFALVKTEDLRVRILDAANGAPLQATIAIETAQGTPLPVQCEISLGGLSHTCSLAPGRYRLRVSSTPGYTTREVDVTAPGSVDVLLD